MNTKYHARAVSARAWGLDGSGQEKADKRTGAGKYEEQHRHIPSNHKGEVHSPIVRNPEFVPAPFV